jgi:hypothetical protein
MILTTQIWITWSTLLQLIRIRYPFPVWDQEGGNVNIAVINLTAPAVTLQTATVGGANSGAIIFADGTVTLAGNIGPGDPASGFLAVLSRDNMTVNFLPALVTPTPDAEPYQFDTADDAYAPELTGIFYAEGVFSTGAVPGQLKINGSVAGLGGVTLGRLSKGPYPAEFVKFNPRMTAIMLEIGLRRKVYFEQQIP